MSLNLASLNQRYNALLSLVNGLVPSVDDIIARIIAVYIPPNSNTLLVKDRLLLTNDLAPSETSELNYQNLIIDNNSTGEQTYIQTNSIQLRNDNGDVAVMSLLNNLTSSDLTFNVNNGIINFGGTVNVGGGINQVDYIEGIVGSNLEISSPNAEIRLQTSGVNRLGINNTGAWTIQGGSSYNNTTNTWTATNFNGTASNITATSDNTSGTYYLPFTKTSGTGSKSLFIDDTTGPLTYNPSTSTLTATTFSGTATTATNATNVNVVATNTTNTNYLVNFSTASGNTSIRSDTNLTYNPSTNLMTMQNLTASTQVSTPLVVNSTGNVEITTQTTTGSLDLNSTILNFKNTSTTTSTANHNVEIKSTSNGVSTTSFLKVKLNGVDIWLPYFTTDPSL